MSRMNLLGRLHGEQRGQALLTFTLMFVVLLGFTAMVVDAGIVYWHRRLLQNAVDAAALAGAAQLPGNPSAAIQAAIAYAQNNGLGPDEIICDPSYPYPAGSGLSCRNGSDPTYGLQVTQTYSPNDTLVISARRPVTFGLRYLFGAGDTNVVATAAGIVAVQTPGNIAPVAISIQQPNVAASNGGTPTPCTSPYTECSIKVGAGSSNQGNFQLIAWDKATPGAGACPGGGNNCVMYSLTSGYPGPIATPVTVVPGPNGTPVPKWSWDVPTQPGAMEIDGMFIPTCRNTTGQAWYGIPLSPGGILGNNIGIYLWR